MPIVVEGAGDVGQCVVPAVENVVVGQADPRVQRWQRRLEPVQRRVAGGCHLTRDIPAALTDAGFEITDLDRFYQRGTPKTFGAMSLGGARAR